MHSKEKSSVGIRKRQWGSEKRTEPLPILHEKPSTLKMALGRLAIILTIVFWVAYIFSIIIHQLMDGPQNYYFTMEALGYAFVVSLLSFSSLMYLISRHGALLRFEKHNRVPRAILDNYFTKKEPSITVLVPSYNEEYQVIRKTLLSAILQEYLNLRVVLLLDDKPYPTNPKELERLETTRNIGKDIKKFLLEPNKHLNNVYKKFQLNSKNKKVFTATEIRELARQYNWTAKWLNKIADKENIEDHVDIFFTEQVLRKLAKDLESVSSALTMSVKEKAIFSKDRMVQLYERLLRIFGGEISIFERKKYASLSHEANKAMNLNSYIGLLGGTYKEVQTPNGIVLTPTKTYSSKNVIIPDSDYVLTLDADSILLREYCMRLVYFLEQPENSRIAVTQTPYSSFRGAYSRIERLAGATTDIQHILHQGLSHYGATFWVGANAVIRKSALNDIVEIENINGFEIKRYIQDRTVIEDTESSIDLVKSGWQLVNYPERLSYSATPPDFGSLIVQRRRWANGGLLILSKLFGQSNKNIADTQNVSGAELLLRINYMASIAWATFGLIFLLAYPYNGLLLSPLVLLSSLPYFLIMASDLKYCGYKYSDIFRIYGFNLIMLPVNLAGVLKSIEQVITGKKIPFARTPKVKNRTPSSLQYVLLPLVIVAFSVFTFWRNINDENWVNAIFSGFNILTATFAIVAYIGIDNLVADIWLGLTDWLYVQDKIKASNNQINKNDVSDWKSILYHGNTKGLGDYSMTEVSIK